MNEDTATLEAPAVAEVETAEQGEMFVLFDPARLPNFDANGFVEHPDAAQFFRETEDGVRLLDLDKMHSAGLDVLCDVGDDNEPPDEEGWVLACVRDVAGEPVAHYVRPLPVAILADAINAADNEGDPLPAIDPDAFDDEDYTPGLVDIRANAMAGDLVKFLIAEFRAARKPWQQMSESDQRDQIDRARKRVEEAITQACMAIASEDRPCIKAMLEQVVVKDGIKATLSLGRMDERRHDLMDAQGREVLIVVSGARGFLTGEMPMPEPVQKRIRFKEEKADKKLDAQLDTAKDTPVADNCRATAVEG